MFRFSTKCYSKAMIPCKTEVQIFVILLSKNEADVIIKIINYIVLSYPLSSTVLRLISQVNCWFLSRKLRIICVMYGIFSLMLFDMDTVMCSFMKTD